MLAVLLKACRLGSLAARLPQHQCHKRSGWPCISAERWRLWPFVAGAALPPLPPVALPRFAAGAPRPSFAELLSASLCQEGELRAWISEMLGYQQVCMPAFMVFALLGECPATGVCGACSGYERPATGVKRFGSL